MTERWDVTLFYTPRSFRITIPKEIVREKGWKKGEKLSIECDDGIITLDSRKKIEKNGEIPVVFSIGYEGKTIERLTEMLKDKGIKQLIDVRMNAFSYKKGFSKTPLINELRKKGIMYVHIPQLGTDREMREEYKVTGDIIKLQVSYREKFEKNLEYYEILKALIYYKKSAIMCFEDDHAYCHRSIIENRLKADNVSVVQLRNGKQNEFF